MNRRLAVVHDWLPTVGGAERLLSTLLESLNYPPVYTTFCTLSEEEKRLVLGDSSLYVTGLNRIPLIKKFYQSLVYFAGQKIRALDLSEYDVVLSQSSCIAKYVTTQSHQIHIAYINTPPRYVWDQHPQYINLINPPFQKLKRIAAMQYFELLRSMDMNSVNSLDYIVANSKNVQSRIWKAYRRESEVIYPPVDTDTIQIEPASSEDIYVTVSRLVHYKNVEMLVKAFSGMPNRKLIIIGDGPQKRFLMNLATKNVTFLGFVSDNEKRRVFARAKAFVYSANEDFGISPLEAQAAGLPVVAPNIGGTKETIVDIEAGSGCSGVLYKYNCIDSFQLSLSKLDEAVPEISQTNCRNNALKYSKKIFEQNILNYINSVS